MTVATESLDWWDKALLYAFQQPYIFIWFKTAGSCPKKSSRNLYKLVFPHVRIQPVLPNNVTRKPQDLLSNGFIPPIPHNTMAHWLELRRFGVPKYALEQHRNIYFRHFCLVLAQSLKLGKSTLCSFLVPRSFPPAVCSSAQSEEHKDPCGDHVLSWFMFLISGFTHQIKMQEVPKATQ